MLQPGDKFERYTIEALLGQGGMGAVYRAFDPRLGRRVALKIISERTAGSEADARLIREARAAAALDHPNAVAIFDVGEYEGAPYIVMELVEGHTLRESVGTGVSLGTWVTRLTDVARALAGAHRRGLVHRDIKPENVMVREDGMVKVLDFGIARRTTGKVDAHAVTEAPALPTITMEGVKMGTPVYMAPEQIRGDALDGRADQFSWGVLAYEVCTGRLPWRGGDDVMAVMASVLTDHVDCVPLDEAGVPRAIQEVVLRALAKRPEDRFATMDELARALEAAGKGEALSVDKTGTSVATIPGVTEAQRFSTGEIREVLSKAVEHQAQKDGSTKLGFDDLLAVAAEVGVDPESLREASRALRARGALPTPIPGPDDAAMLAPGDSAKRETWLRRQRRDLRRHGGVYFIVNAGLLILGLVLLGAYTPWWIWFLPALAWGIGLAIHALVAMTANEDDWKEHEEEMRTWHESRRRKHEQRMAAMATGRGGRQRKRVAGATEAEPGKMRVAPSVDTGGEQAAEEEAAAAASQVERRRR